jgi:serine/threonine protein phosphatase 1
MDSLGEQVAHDLAIAVPPMGPTSTRPRLRSSLRLFRRGWPAAGAAPSTNGELVYAIGDVHGRYDLLIDLLRRLGRDIGVRAGGRRPIVITCGDYVDRGSDSAKVLETIVQLRRRRDISVIPLKGNHEAALLDVLSDPATFAAWLQFGGVETLASYGVRPPGVDSLDRLQASRALKAALPAEHLALLESLQLMAIVGDYVFVHAGVRPGVPLRRQTEADMLWIRKEFLDREERCSKFIVHGHSWKDSQPLVTKRSIGIDTGAYATGVLTAVRLDGDEQAFISTG